MLTALEINFFAGSKYLLLDVKVSSKTNIRVANIGGQWPYKNPLTYLLVVDRLKTKHNSIMVKCIDNAFDHMELCLVLTDK